MYHYFCRLFLLIILMNKAGIKNNHEWSLEKSKHEHQELHKGIQWQGMKKYNWKLKKII